MFVLVLLLLLPLLTRPPERVQAQTMRRCFAETGLCIKGRIREFWEQNGGLPVFGLPITPQQEEIIEGQAVQVQWFERNRLELHPENEPPYDVLLGRIGQTLLNSSSVKPVQTSSEPEPETEPATDANCHFFAETGHTVCGDILAAWRSHGLEIDGQPGFSTAESLALSGLPLSDERVEVLENGKPYRVQWFERARFELHPELEPPSHVQLGLLGSMVRGSSVKEWAAYRPFACPFSVPADMVVECGFLSVPEDRSDPNSRDIQLAVAIVHTLSPNPLPDPLVYLAGGPGGAALESTMLFARAWAAFLSNRDFVLIDQRGTGFSQPALDCPESSQLAQELLGQEISRAEKVEAEVTTALHCRDRLASAGINLAGYTSADSAADLEDLRLALGYQQWNLFGISYGTRLALTALRDYPEGIRSVILDSTYPPQVNLFTEMPANLHRSLNTLFDNCASNAECNQAYPDLKQVFSTLMEQLNAEPVVVYPVHPVTGEVVKVRVDGVELLSLMFRLLYDSGSIPSLPQLIYATRDGDYSLLTRMQQRRLARGSGRFSHGMYFSVQCSEEIVFTSPEEVVSAIEAYPQLQAFFAGIPENTREIFALCDAWGVTEPDPIENQPVSSDIPALILAGEYDPITPPAWGYLAASKLSTSYVYEFPGTGHAVISRGFCPQRLIQDFLHDPTTPPDGSCIE